MSKKQPEPFQTIDPTNLAQVSGGTVSSGNSEVMAALTGVLDSIKGLAANQNQGGMDPTMMMMMMMMMGGGGQSAAPAQVVAANPYAGYTVDGVFYPFR
ncbi:MAG: hypothetical protein ABI867_31600 [Kofleriaceae bacterium]